MEIHEKSAVQLAKEIKDKTNALTAVEVVKHFLERIKKYNPRLNAFLRVNEQAVKEAEKIDRQIKASENPGPLAGVPVAVKDNIVTKGMHTTAASRILENYIPPYDADVVEKLRNAGAVIIGKTNLDEFAMGSSSEFSAFGVTRNPWDYERVPGGSSSGSAAAVAARLAPIALGSDTGGSIRQPASFCGTVGMKPSYHRVSRYGLIAFASSLDQIGVFANSVEDAALLLQVIEGDKNKDGGTHRHDTTLRLPPETEKQKDFSGVARGDIPALNIKKPGAKGLKIGVPREYFTEGMDPEVEKLVRKAIQTLEDAGAEIGETTLPHMKHSIAAYYIIADAELSSNLARYDGVRYGVRREADDVISMFRKSRSAGFGPEVTRRIFLGTFALSSGYYDDYYNKARKARRLILNDFENAFINFDVLACPTMPMPAFRFGEKTGDPLSMYLSDALTVSVNMAGLPGISVPCGVTSENLPVGLQLISPWWGDDTVLQAAGAYERAADMDNGIPLLQEQEV